MDITRESQYKLYKIDKNKNGVSYSEISSIDKNKDGKIDIKEASKIGINNVKDIDEINKNVLEFYKDANKSKHDANEIVFPRPDKNKNPVNIEPNEKTKLKFLGLDEKQSTINSYMTDVADYVGIGINKIYSKIDENSDYIKKISETNKVDPIIVASIVFDELSHVKPGESIAVSFGRAKTFGIAQIGLGELIKQGFFEKYNFSKQSEVSQLPKELKEIGINCFAKS